MPFLADSFASALGLIFAWDPQLAVIVKLSVTVSSISTLLAGVIGVPLAFAVAFNRFYGKRLVLTVINTLLSVPTVVIGLFVYAFIARRGPLGAFGLLYTPGAIIIGQVLLIVPLITALTLAAINRMDARYRRTAKTLGASGRQVMGVVFKEARFGIAAAVITAFGRVISEIGISMMLGGNIKGFTRTITTAMALEYDKGAFTLAVALGMVLLVVSFGINLLFHFIQGKTGEESLWP